MKKLLIVLSILSILVISGCEKCGDGECTEKETKCTCPQDCGECAGIADTCKEYYCSETQCLIRTVDNCCGNQICEIGENHTDCQLDCPNCDDDYKCTTDYFDYEQKKCINEEITPCCGNNIKEKGETCSNCKEDVVCSSGTLCCLGTCRKPACNSKEDCSEKELMGVVCDSPNTCNSKCKYTSWSPTKVVDTYFIKYNALLFTDYGLMFKLLASSVRPESKDHLQVEVENHKHTLTWGLTSCSRVRVDNEKIYGDTATVDVVYKTSVVGFKEIKTKKVTLVKEEGLWKTKEKHLCDI